MSFQDRFIVTGNVNGKFYFDISGREVYGGNSGRQVAGATDYLRSVLTSHAHEFGKYSVLLGVLWAHPRTEKRMMEIICFGNPDVWPGSPELTFSSVCEYDIHRKDYGDFQRGEIVMDLEVPVFDRSASLQHFLEAEMPASPLIVRGSQTHYLRI